MTLAIIVILVYVFISELLRKQQIKEEILRDMKFEIKNVRLGESQKRH